MVIDVLARIRVGYAGFSGGRGGRRTWIAPEVVFVDFGRKPIAAILRVDLRHPPTSIRQLDIDPPSSKGAADCCCWAVTHGRGCVVTSNGCLEQRPGVALINSTLGFVVVARLRVLLEL